MPSLSLPVVSSCASLLCLAVAAIATVPEAHAQTTVNLRTVATFNGATGSAPNQALIFGSDGNLYGTAPQGGANNLGTFYRVNPDGRVTLLYRFGDNRDTLPPASPLLQAADGRFYGLAGTTDITDKAVYRVDTAGVFNTVHAFAPDGSEGTNVVSGLTLGNDGALYGVTQNGGRVTAANPPGDGTVFRVTTDGQFSTIYDFNFNRAGFGGSEPSVPLVLGSDGSLYGLTLFGGDFGVGAFYKLSVGGQVTTLYSFTGKEGANPAGALVEGSQGNFYGITTTGASGQGVFFRVTSSGGFTILHAFTATEKGVAAQGGYPQPGLLKATDGNFYLTVQSSDMTPDHILQITPEGIVTTVFQLGANSPGSLLAGGLVQAPDGSFYGTTVQGGPSSDGLVFRLTISPYPTFFNGSADVGNGVNYLAFPGGTFFGYYSFLADPHYIYHQDLGYEYVFDAQDEQSGVYLYDFTSNDFFYTSPVFPFPYLYSFNLETVLYYYPDSRRPGRYNTNEVRYFYDFAIGQIIRY